MTDTPLASPPARGRPWTAASLIGDGWRAIKADPSLILVMLLVMVVANLIDIAFSIAGEIVGGDAQTFLEIAGAVLNLPLNAWITVGWLRYILAAMRGERPGIGVVFAGGPVLAMLGMYVVYAVCVLLGLVLLIVPAFILVCGWWVAGFSIVDRHKGPIQCLADSWALTRGYKWEIMLLLILEFLIVVAGLLACGVGIFVALPIVAASSTALYQRLIGEEPTLGAPAVR